MDEGVGPVKTKRSAVACIPCRKLKVRCDARLHDRSDKVVPCSRCGRLGIDCILQTAVRSKQGPKVYRSSLPGATGDGSGSGSGSANVSSSNGNTTNVIGAPIGRSSPLNNDAAVGSSVSHHGNNLMQSVSSTSPRTAGPFPTLPNALDLLAGASQNVDDEEEGHAGIHRSPTSINAAGIPSVVPAPIGANGSAPSTSATTVPQRQIISSSSPALQLEPLPPACSLRTDASLLREGLAYLATGPTATSPDDGYSSNRMNSGSDGDRYFASKISDKSRRDLGSELDPVTLGIVDADELPDLFRQFFREIHPLAPVLDPVLYTPEYVRSRSALLLTAISIVAAQTMIEKERLTSRLYSHIEHLREIIVKRNLRSLEIVQGINVLSCWPRSAQRLEDDQQSRWLNLAIGMTLDLRIDRTFDRTAPNRQASLPSRPPTPTRDANSQMSMHERTERYIRSRQRAFIGVFVWDRSFALATGRSWTFMDSSITGALNGWESEEFACPEDAHLADVLSLRLQSSAIRTAILSAQMDAMHTDEESDTTRTVLELAKEHLDNWKPRQSVLHVTTSPTAYKQAICLNLAYAQTKLWALALGLPYASGSQASGELQHACWKQAIDSCETVAIHADVLRNLPASSALMIIYGALLAISLYSLEYGVPKTAVLGLVAQVSKFLTSTGINPPHRSGPNAIYGRHLLRILRAEVSRQTSNQVSSDAIQQDQRDNPHQDTSLLAVNTANLGFNTGSNSTFSHVPGSPLLSSMPGRVPDDLFENLFYSWPPAAATATATGFGFDGLGDFSDASTWPSLDWMALQTTFVPPQE